MIMIWLESRTECHVATPPPLKRKCAPHPSTQHGPTLLGVILISLTNGSAVEADMNVVPV